MLRGSLCDSSGELRDQKKVSLPPSVSVLAESDAVGSVTADWVFDKFFVAVCAEVVAKFFIVIATVAGFDLA